MKKPFFSIYSHGIIRTAVAIPETSLSNPSENVKSHIQLAKKASESFSALVIFPELGISGYSNEDLFHQKTLIDSSMDSFLELVRASEELFSIIVAGLPIEVDGLLFNCAAVVFKGKVLGIVPKTFLPNHREFYEKRQFAAAKQNLAKEILIDKQMVPFGTDLIFACENLPAFKFGIEICEDLWAPISPGTFASMAGATIIANLSASNIVIGKSDYRRLLAKANSAKCLSGYLYSAAGNGESTTDLAWDGQGLIVENGKILAETERFASSSKLIMADIDVDMLHQERMRTTNFRDSIALHKDNLSNFRRIKFNLQNLPDKNLELISTKDRFPFIPNEKEARAQRCMESYNIQVHGLVQRLKSSHINKIVIGVSGGLDSTQALLVACKAIDLLGLSRKNILAYTMPGFATSDLTKSNAFSLMDCLGVTSREIDIKPACMQVFKELDHPFSRGEEIYDITFENVQAGERTSFLFRLANMHKAIVLGTGDLSELALGWCTYGVGDHMSHYNVNASVPKTLIQYLIRWVAETQAFGKEAAKILLSVLSTEISPELIPGRSNTDPQQKTEQSVGPYELQDFNLYYITRYGFKPSKVAFLAHSAWSNINNGDWPEDIAVEKRNAYPISEIKKWLEVFLKRFFGQTQFKRSCVPNGPKVGSGGSLSPRGDWRAPSDSQPDAWLKELSENVPF